VDATNSLFEDYIVNRHVTVKSPSMTALPSHRHRPYIQAGAVTVNKADGSQKPLQLPLKWLQPAIL
jgi:hypothetical protein